LPEYLKAEYLLQMNEIKENPPRIPCHTLGAKLAGNLETLGENRLSFVLA
jgi:hypothetical protein